MRRKCKRDHHRRDKAKLEAMLGGMRPVKEPPPGYNAIDADEAMESDREWFAAHPEATWRLRRGIGGEIGTPHPSWVVCFQVEPGARIRVPLDGTLPDDQVELLGETGDFRFYRGYPVWMPREEGHEAIAAGRLVVPCEWVPMGDFAISNGKLQ